jgi:hypothetical protein
MPRRWWLIVVPVFVAATWPRLAFTRLYDPDEFEHLHAAWCVAQGQVPYRDFFEHHGPLTYYLLAPFAVWIGDTPALLTVHRGLSAFWILVCVAGLYAWFGKGASDRIGWGFLWLSTYPWFLEKAIEGRPDVPAMALMTWAAWFTRRGSRSRGLRWPLAAGLTMGVASLFTQKVIFLASGMALGGCLAVASRGRTPGPSIVVGAIGFAIPWAAAAVFFHDHDAFSAFLNRTLATPATWPAHLRNPDESILHRLANVVSWSPGHLAILAICLGAGFVKLWNSASWRRGDGITWCGLVVHLTCAPLVPAYLQYYLLAAPMGAMVVGGRLPALVRRIPFAVGALVFTAFMAAAALRFPELRALSSPFAVADAPIVVGMIIAFGLLSAGAFMRRRSGVAIAAAAVILASMAPGIGRYMIHHRYWNFAEKQRQDLVAFGELSPGPVLDGFTGFGCLRPHVGYWWWINHHSLPLMRKEGALQGVLESIRAGKPSVVVYDEGVRKIGGGIEGLLLQFYEPASFRGVPVFVRRASPSE